MHADQISASTALLKYLARPMVFDHMGRLPLGTRPKAHLAFDLMTGLARDGRAWVKISSPCQNRRDGYTGATDAGLINQAWIEEFPDRSVGASDWPHNTEQPDPPSPAAIAATLAE